MKTFRYFIEAVLLYCIYYAFKILPVGMASNIGGAIGRTIGPRLGASRKALTNIQATLPALSTAEHTGAISEMWDNLGRVIAEYPHLKTIGTTQTEIIGTEHIKAALAQDKPVILFSGHFANWEICAPTMLSQLDEVIDITYRAPNNPWSDRLLEKARTLNGKIKAYSKSRAGGKSLIEAIKNKHCIGILIDQKYNEGIAVPFLGRPAMTNPIFVTLAKKYDAILIPVSNERHDGAHFKLTFHPPIDAQGATEEVIERAHTHLESWVKDRPGQWLWLHRRWNSSALKSN